MSEQATLPLEAIWCWSKLQHRNDLDFEAVAELADRYAEGGTLPPIRVIRCANSNDPTQTFLLIGGHHRLEAKRRSGSATIEAVVEADASDGELIERAYADNRNHGKPYTLEERRKRARKLLAISPTLSSREIGRRVGLCHDTVEKLRHEDGGGIAPRERKPGELEADIGLFDPIRCAKATRQQKAVAGYIQRLVDALEDPYSDEDDSPGVVGWCDNPAVIAEACLASMGAQRARKLIEKMEYDAKFLLRVVAVHSSLLKRKNPT